MDHITDVPKLAYTLMGAQVLQTDLGREFGIFYRSPVPSGCSIPARGGVPVLFPQFADRGPLPRHGLVRTPRWTKSRESASAHEHSITFELAIGAWQFPDWPNACHLTLTAIAEVDRLHMSLQITNTGQDAFAWTGGLHPYFAVEDLQTCALAGLVGLAVQDRHDASLTKELDHQTGLGSQPFERLYDGCPPLRLFTGPRWLTITATGFEQWMVWNPGQTDGDALQDLPIGDWRRFVCVEPVCVTRPVELAPGAIFNGTLTVSVPR